MNKPKGRNKKIQPEQKLSFGSALKQNVIIIISNFPFLEIQFKNTGSVGKKPKKSEKTRSANKKSNIQTIPISKIDESYNTDKSPDILNGRDESNDYKNDRRGYLQDIQSESSSFLNSARVKNYFIIIHFIFYREM